ncbi:MAG: lytic transglycosylase domain-containing protein [Pseudomonadota bacterium]
MADLRALMVFALAVCLPPMPVVAEGPRPELRPAEAATPPVLRPRPRPNDLRRASAWCTADGALCIDRARYIPDVCRAVAFLARLIWKESLFDRTAVSHAGAEGIAQFIPETAARRGLDDVFNPAKALAASAAYLADLRRDFGNLGLAAAAYNAGEGRVSGFVAGERTLPRETRNYVYAITGYSGLAWRDFPPEKVGFLLDDGRPFQAACEDRAGRRVMREFGPQKRLTFTEIGGLIQAGAAEKYHALMEDAGEPEISLSTLVPIWEDKPDVIRLGRMDADDLGTICRLMPGCRIVRN